MSRRDAVLLGRVNRLWNLGTFTGLTDAQLLTRFAGAEESSELAFETLVGRHGPMVLRVCRGVLVDEHAAEDAFQATFLVLVKKASSLWVKDSLASWLHGVAHRVATRARADAVRRRRHEQKHAEVRGPTLEVLPDQPRLEACAILSEEIAGLPETYRAPVVLCYLEAMSYQAAATTLGLTEDAVRGRLARARERLRKSLGRRGIEVPAIMAATRPAILIRNGLVQATSRAAIVLSAGGAGSTLSRTVISLYERTCMTMLLTNLKAAAAAVVLVTVAAGTIVSAQQAKARRAELPGPATAEIRPPEATRAKGGNFIVDWIPADGVKKEIIVNPLRHCTHLPWVSQKRDNRPNDGAVRLDLERGKSYMVTAADQAFMSEHTGHDADPYPGVVVIYPTDEEDCYATRQIVLAPGRSITFRSPWLIKPNDEVFLLAFFLDSYTGGLKRGSYTLTIEETSEQARNGADKASGSRVLPLKYKPLFSSDGGFSPKAE